MKNDHYYNHYWSERGNAEYDAPYFKPMKQFLLREIMPLNKRLDILDAGCGAAAFTPILKNFSSTIVATDISAEQIEINQEKHQDIKFMFADLSEPLPFKDNSFDIIWSSEVLEHLYFPLFALQEFHRVLRPGGKALLTVPYHGLFKNLIIALFKFDRHYDPKYPHVRFFTKKTLSKLVLKSGFGKIFSYTCGMDDFLRDMIIPTNLLVSAQKKI